MIQSLTELFGLSSALADRDAGILDQAATFVWRSIGAVAGCLAGGRDDEG